MTLRPRHEWEEGARVNGAQLAACPHCGTLRVSLAVGPVVEVHFIRRRSDVAIGADDACMRAVDVAASVAASDLAGKETLVDVSRHVSDPEARVTLVEPRCLEAAEHFRAPW